MDITTFNERLGADVDFRTEVLSAISAEIKKNGLDGPVTIGSDNDGSLVEFVYDPQGTDPASQLAAANAAINAIKNAGVTDLSGISNFDPVIDPYAWNVVYKDGGWVVNGLVTDDAVSGGL